MSSYELGALPLDFYRRDLCPLSEFGMKQSRQFLAQSDY